MSNSSTQRPPPVLVVGAGPVGMTLAVELSRYGAPVRIIDQRLEPAVESKAIGIHARTLEYIEGMGLIDEFLANGLPIKNVNIHMDGKRTLQIKLDRISSPFPYALNIPQTKTEAILAGHLEKSGITIERGTKLVALSQHTDHVQTLVHHHDGTEERIDASYVVGCDGADSLVRQQAEIPFVGSDSGDVFVIADVSLAGSFETDGWHIFLHDSGLFLLFPLPDERWRVIANLKEEPPRLPDLAFFQKLMADRKVPPTALTECHWSSTFTVRKRIAPSYHQGRVFLAGDAAHVHSPAGGQGMNTGIQDSINLAWKLSYVLAGRAPASLLDSYNAERVKIGNEVLAMTERLTQVATMRNALAIKLRRVMLPFFGGLDFVQYKVAGSLEEVSINYRGTRWVADAVGIAGRTLTPSLFGTSGPVPGDRAPDGTVTGAIDGKAHRLFSFFAQKRFTLLVFLNKAEDAETLKLTAKLLREITKIPSADMQTLLISGRHIPEDLNEFKDLIYLDARSSVHQLYGVSSTAALHLVRPDGYISFRSIPPQWKPLEKHLRHYLTAY